MPYRISPNSIRVAASGALHVDTALVVPVAGAVTALPVAGLFALGLLLWTPAVTTGLALGAWFVGLAARTTGPRPASSTMVLDTAGLAVSALVGAACSGAAWLHVSTLVLWCFVGGLVVALGPGRSVVGVQGVMAIVVFGRTPQTWHQAVMLAATVAVGGAVQTAVQLLVRVPIGLRQQRAATALVFRELAGLAGSVGGRPGTWSTAVATAVDRAMTTLEPASLFGRPDVQALRGMVDEARRMRLELITVDGLFRRLPGEAGPGPAIDAALAAAAQTMLDLADAVSGARPDRRRERGRAVVRSDLVDSLAGVGSAIGSRPSADEVAVHVLAHLRSLSGQLRAAGRLVGLATDVRTGSVLQVAAPRRRSLRSDLASVWEVLSGSLTSRSPAFRHAVRLAVVVPVLDVGFHHSGLARSYWVPLSAAVVLRPDYVSTMTRGLSRVGGSAVGVGVIGVLVAVAHPGPAATVALVALTGWGAFAFVQSNYGLGVAFLTGLVLLLVGVGQPDTLAIAGYRLLDTVIGGTVALVAYLAWPTWSGEEARQSLRRLIAAQREYVDAVLRGFNAPAPVDPDELRSLGRAARLAYTDAQAAVGRSLADPPAHRIDPEVGRGALAALRRLIRAAHGLRTELPGTTGVPGMEGFALAVDESCRRMEAGLDRDRPVGHLPPLRSLLDRMRDDPAAVPVPVAIPLDELVDAIDTVGQLLGAGEPDRTG